MPRDVPGESLSVAPTNTNNKPTSLGTGAVGFLNRMGRFSERGFAKLVQLLPMVDVCSCNHKANLYNLISLCWNPLSLCVLGFFFKLRCYCTAYLLSIPLVQACAITFCLCQLASVPHVSTSVVWAVNTVVASSQAFESNQRVIWAYREWTDLTQAMINKWWLKQTRNFLVNWSHWLKNFGNVFETKLLSDKYHCPKGST